MMDKQEITRSTKSNSSYSASSLFFLCPCCSSPYHAVNEERHGLEHIIGILDQALAIVNEYDDDHDTSTLDDDDPASNQEQEQQQQAPCQSPRLLLDAAEEAPDFPLNLVLVEDRDATFLEDVVDVLAAGEDDDPEQ
jgi:hypothetical protein